MKPQRYRENGAHSPQNDPVRDELLRRGDRLVSGSLGWQLLPPNRQRPVKSKAEGYLLA